MSEATPVVKRFHELLVEEIRTRKPEYLDSPFTVAEIYQHLVPYQSHRDRLGVQMNGDYEDALVRLLAGEGGFLVLDSEAAVRELREELDASNPNTGIYREFAAVDVRLGAAAGRGAPPPTPGRGSAELSAPGRAPIPQGVSGGRPAAPSAAPPHPRSGGNETASGAEPGATCRWCSSELPPRAGLRYCPFCGGDVNVVPCADCGEELEAGWRFCIACGSEVER